MGILTEREFENGEEISWIETNSVSGPRILEVQKKGKYEEVVNEDGGIQTIEGDWFWVQSDKKKTRLALDDDFQSYEVDRLTNKELILKRVRKTSYEEDMEIPQIYEVEEEFTFSEK